MFGRLWARFSGHVLEICEWMFKIFGSFRGKVFRGQKTYKKPIENLYRPIKTCSKTPFCLRGL